MTTPTYRSINLTATLLGIDRRLCIVILLVAFLVFRHATFLSALATFCSALERRVLDHQARRSIDEAGSLRASENGG
jgi:hypothetical protein